MGKHDLNCAGELRNGDFEASNSFPLNWSNQGMTYGLNTYDMVNVLEMEIVPGENNEGNALHAYNRNAWWASPQLEIDSSCFKLGQLLEFSAKIKLESEDGSSTECNPGQIWGKHGVMDGACPIMTLEMTLPGGEVTYADVAYLVGPYKTEWNSMYGTFVVSEDFLNAEKINLKWYKYIKKYGFTVDDVLIEEVVNGCGDLIKNGGGEEGDLRGWQCYGSNDVVHALEYVPNVTIGTGHFVSKNRQNHDDGIMTLLDTNCVNATSFYQISAKFKLAQNVSVVPCDYLGTATTGTEIPRCPMIHLGSRNLFGAAQYRPLASLDTPYSFEDWNTISSIFQFFSNEISAEETYVYISGSPPGTDILVDEVSLVEFILP